MFRMLQESLVMRLQTTRQVLYDVVRYLTLPHHTDIVTRTLMLIYEYVVSLLYLHDITKEVVRMTGDLVVR